MKLAIASGLIGLGVLFTPQVDWKIKIATSLVFATPGVVSLFSNEKVLTELTDSIAALLEEIEQLEDRRKELAVSDEELLNQAKLKAEVLIQKASDKLEKAEVEAQSIIDKATQEGVLVRQEYDRLLQEVQSKECEVTLAEQEGLNKIKITMEAALNQAARIKQEAQHEAASIKEKAEKQAIALTTKAQNVLEKAKIDTKAIRAVSRSLIASSRSKAQTKGTEILNRKQQQADHIIAQANTYKVTVEGEIALERSLLEADRAGWRRQRELEEGSVARLIEIERQTWEKEKIAEQQALQRERLTWEEERHLLEIERERAFMKHLEEVEAQAVEVATEAVEEETARWREQQLNNVVIPLRQEVERLTNLVEEFKRRYDLERDRNQRLLLPTKADESTAAGRWANKLIEWFWDNHAIALNHKSSASHEGKIEIRLQPHPGHPPVYMKDLKKVMETASFTNDLNVPRPAELDYCEEGWKFTLEITPAPWGGKPPIDEPAIRAIYGKVSPEILSHSNSSFSSPEVGALSEAKEYINRMVALNPKLPMSRIPGFNEKISEFEIESVDWLCRYRERATGKLNITEPMLIAEALYGIVINEEKANSPLASTERFLVQRVEGILEHIGFEAE